MLGADGSIVLRRVVGQRVFQELPVVMVGFSFFASRFERKMAPLVLGGGSENRILQSECLFYELAA